AHGPAGVATGRRAVGAYAIAVRLDLDLLRERFRFAPAVRPRLDQRAHSHFVPVPPVKRDAAILAAVHEQPSGRRAHRHVAHFAKPLAIGIIIVAVAQPPIGAGFTLLRGDRQGEHRREHDNPCTIDHWAPWPREHQTPCWSSEHHRPPYDIPAL